MQLVLSDFVKIEFSKELKTVLNSKRKDALVTVSFQMAWIECDPCLWVTTATDNTWTFGWCYAKKILLVFTWDLVRFFQNTFMSFIGQPKASTLCDHFKKYFPQITWSGDPGYSLCHLTSSELRRFFCSTFNSWNLNFQFPGVLFESSLLGTWTVEWVERSSQKLQLRIDFSAKEEEDYSPHDASRSFRFLGDKELAIVPIEDLQKIFFYLKQSTEIPIIPRDLGWLRADALIRVSSCETDQRWVATALKNMLYTNKPVEINAYVFPVRHMGHYATWIKEDQEQQQADQSWMSGTYF